MKILVFTEGTVLIPKFAEGRSREEVIELNKKEVAERKRLKELHGPDYDIPVEPNSAHDFASYIPHGNSVEKLKKWQSQGAEILYISSREIEPELEVKQLFQYFYNRSETGSEPSLILLEEAFLYSVFFLSHRAYHEYIR